MNDRDRDHWLWRLSAADWLAAAGTELEQGRARQSSRRAAVTHARRSAGMALNAVLVTMAARGWSKERCETAWGRSYIDHLRALRSAVEGQEGESSPEPFEREQCERCRDLLAIQVMPPANLVKLATHRDEAAKDALALATAIVRACAGIIGS